MISFFILLSFPFYLPPLLSTFLQLNLRIVDKEILQDLLKVRVGIHEIRENQNKQLETEKKYLNTSTTSSLLEPPPSNESELPPDSPLTPCPLENRLLDATRNLAGAPPSRPGRQEDDAVLESFFGTEQMCKLNEFKRAISIEDMCSTGETEATANSGSSKLPPIPEKKRGKSQRLPVVHLRSPNLNQVYGSSPDITVNKPSEPVGDVLSEMQKLRIRLREIANQTVAEIEMKFSPKLERLQLGPSIELDPEGSTRAGGSVHSHQGSLDSSIHLMPPPSQQPPGQRGHSRQYSLPTNVVAATHPSHAHSPPKSPSPTHNGVGRGHRSRSPSSPSQSPTFQQYRSAQQGPQGPTVSSGAFSPPLSGLITTSYQTSGQELTQDIIHTSKSVRNSSPSQGGKTSSHPQLNGSRHSSSSATSPTSSGPVAHRPAPPPPVSRKRSPSGQAGMRPPPAPPGNGKRGSGSAASGGNGRSKYNAHQSSLDMEHGHRYASNPNLYTRSSSMHKSSTSYSTTVIKKRRSDGKINVPASVNDSQLQDGYSTNTNAPSSYEQPGYDHLMGSGEHTQTTHHQHSHKEATKPLRPFSARRANDHHVNSGVHPRGRSIKEQSEAFSGSERNLRSPEQIKPYMSTGELPAELKKTFNYVPYTEQVKANKSGLDGDGQGRNMPRYIPENTWC